MTEYLFETKEKQTKTCRTNDKSDKNKEEAVTMDYLLEAQTGL